MILDKDNRPILDPKDLQTECWAKMKRYCEARLDTLRRENEQNLDAEETARVRGRIAELKRFLDLETRPEFVDKRSRPAY